MVVASNRNLLQPESQYMEPRVLEFPAAIGRNNPNLLVPGGMQHLPTILILPSVAGSGLKTHLSRDSLLDLLPKVSVYILKQGWPSFGSHWG